MMSVKEGIAKNLLFYRKKNRLTQKQFAEMLGVKNSAVSNWENGQNSIDIETLYKACEIFGVTLNDMYDRESNNFSLSNHEKNIILAYRNNPNMQESVCRLLGVEFETSNTTIYRAASSSDNHLHTVEKRPMSDIDKFRNADKVTSEEDL